MKGERQIYRFEVKRGKENAMDSYSVIVAHVMCDDDGCPIIKANGEYQFEQFSQPMTLTEARLDLPGILGTVFNQILRRNDLIESTLMNHCWSPPEKPAPQIAKDTVTTPPPLPVKTSWLTKIKAWFT